MAPQWTGWPVRCAPYRYWPLEAARAGAGRGARAKRENPRRSIRQIRLLLEAAGLVPRDTLSRCAVHRLLKAHGISRIAGTDVVPEEKRSFAAEHAGSIWYGDVMHGPTLSFGGRRMKTYLVSLMDDASRLIAHSAFCLSETALDIEGVLKQALLRRGVPKTIVVDNGAAYRAAPPRSRPRCCSVHPATAKP